MCLGVKQSSAGESAAGCEPPPLVFFIIVLFYGFPSFLSGCLIGRGWLQESICLAATLPPSRLHSEGQPAQGRAGSAACAVTPRAARGLQHLTSLKSQIHGLQPAVCFGRTHRPGQDADWVGVNVEKRDVSCCQEPAAEVDLAEGRQPAGVVVPAGHRCREAQPCPRSCCPPWKIIPVPGMDTRGPPCSHLPGGDEHLALREAACGAVLALGGTWAAARNQECAGERRVPGVCEDLKALFWGPALPAFPPSAGARPASAAGSAPG